MTITTTTTTLEQDLAQPWIAAEPVTIPLTQRQQALVLAHIKTLDAQGTPQYWTARKAFKALQSNKV